MNNNQNNPLQKFIDYFFAINPYEYALLADLIATLFAIPLTNPQRGSLGNWLESIGQQLLAIQSQINAQSNVINSNSINSIIEAIKNLNFKFEYLEEMINYLKGEEKNERK